jgi:hypothetical protein
MNEIAIVKRRARVLPIVLMLLVVALLVLAGLWMLGMLPGIEAARIDALHDAEWDTLVYQTTIV